MLEPHRWVLADRDVIVENDEFTLCTNIFIGKIICAAIAIHNLEWY